MTWTVFRARIDGLERRFEEVDYELELEMEERAEPEQRLNDVLAFEKQDLTIIDGMRAALPKQPGEGDLPGQAGM